MDTEPRVHWSSGPTISVRGATSEAADGAARDASSARRSASSGARSSAPRAGRLAHARAVSGRTRRPGSVRPPSPTAPAFRPWASDEGPPSHSIPRIFVAKAAAALGPEAFAAMHARLPPRPTSERAATSANARRNWRSGARSASADEAFRARRRSRDARGRPRRASGGVAGRRHQMPAVMMVGNDVPTLGAMPCTRRTDVGSRARSVASDARVDGARRPGRGGSLRATTRLDVVGRARARAFGGVIASAGADRRAHFAADHCRSRRRSPARTRG